MKIKTSLFTYQLSSHFKSRHHIMLKTKNKVKIETSLFTCRLVLNFFDNQLCEIFSLTRNKVILSYINLNLINYTGWSNLTCRLILNFFDNQLCQILSLTINKVTLSYINLNLICYTGWSNLYLDITYIQTFGLSSQDMSCIVATPTSMNDIPCIGLS